MDTVLVSQEKKDRATAYKPLHDVWIKFGSCIFLYHAIPQKWHMPRSIMKPEPVMQSARLNPLKGRSGKRETAVTCTLYKARRNQATIRQQTMDIVRQRLININPQIPFVHLLECTQVRISKHSLKLFQRALCTLINWLIWNQDLK